MIDSKLLKFCADKEWYAKCYSEYMQDVANNNSMVKQGLEQIMATDIDEVESELGVDANNYSSKLQQVKSILLSRFNSHTGYSMTLDTTFPILEGYVSIGSIIEHLIKTCSTEFGIQDELETTDLVSIILPDRTSATIDGDEILSQIGDMINQAVYSAAAFKAMAFNTVSDRLITFGNYITQFSSGNSVLEGVSQLKTLYSSLISESKDVVSFLEQFINLSGINAIADDRDETTTYSDTDFAKYTGSSPAMAADFSSITKSASTIIKTGAKIVAGVLGAGLTIVKGLFNKVGDYISDAVIDPEFMKYSDDASFDNTIDGFEYSGTINWFIESYPISILQSSDVSRIIALYNSSGTSSENKWIQMRCRFADIMFRINTVQHTIEYKLKPKTINSSSPYMVAANTLGLRYADRLITNTETAIDIITSLESDLAQLQAEMDSFPDYLGKDADKYDAFAAVNDSLAAMSSLVPLMFLEVFVKCPVLDTHGSLGYDSVRVDSSGTYIGRVDYLLNANEYLKRNQSGLVNNANMVSLCSGYDYATHMLTDNFSGISVDPTTGDARYDTGTAFGNARSVAWHFALMFMIQTIYRRSNPSEYLFIPFSNNTINFAPGKWSIKTDAEVQEAASNLIAVAIIAVVGIALGSLLKIGFNKIKRVILNKSLQRKAELDYLMEHGYALTKKEMRQAKRINKRLSKSGLLSGGTVVYQTPSVAQQPTVQSDNNELLQLIYNVIV